MTINPTSERVRLNTAGNVNARLHEEAERRITYYVAHPEQIDQRLRELDQEWDIERMIETEAPTLTLTGILMGAVLGRKWLILPLFAQSMVFFHSLQGWYPLLPVFRRMGFRTGKEIAAERYALKAIRGDFERVGQSDGDGRQRADQAFEAVQASGT